MGRCSGNVSLGFLGAKIFLKAGLIPAKMTEREINVNEEGIKGAE